jgi:uncharacterized delta-60 repeat protein
VKEGIMDRKKKIWLLSLLLPLIAGGLVYCGGGGGENATSGGSGWIEINNYSATQTGGSQELDGTCFRSTEDKEVAAQTCRCTWAECLVNESCWDIRYIYTPRVHISVTNQTTGAETFGSITNKNSSSYTWSATVSVRTGENSILVRADDGEGNSGTDTITLMVPTGEISGTVTAPDGTAMPGIAITLSDDASQSTTTGINGNYAFSGLYAGSYTITPSGIAVTPVGRTVTLTSSHLPEQDFTVTGSAVSGRTTVTDGSPLPGATVTISGTASASAATYANGYYIFRGLYPGSYTIIPTTDCPTIPFTPSSRNVNISDTDVTGQDFVIPALSAGISGTITDASRAALAGVTVNLSDEINSSTITDMNGYYSFTGIQVGTTYSVTPSMPGYLFSSARVTLCENDVTGFDFTSTVTMAKTYGSHYHTTDINDIQVTADGGFIAAGHTYSYGAGNSDIWVMKLDGIGNSVWQKTYGGANDDHAQSIQVTADGGYVVAGHTYSYGAGNSDIWVLKLDANGNPVWQKTYGGAYYDHAQSIQVTVDGGYVVAGNTSPYETGSGSDIWVLKLDGNGNPVWWKTYGGAHYDGAQSIQVTADGGYVVVGQTTSYGSANTDIWVLKLDANGNSVWQKTYGWSGGLIHAQSIQVTSDGSYVVAGYYNSSMPGKIWVLRLDESGNAVWWKTYGGSRHEFGGFIQVTADGGYVVAGNTSSYGSGSSDLWVLKLDAFGDFIWQKAYAGAYFAQSIQVTADGGYVVKGKSLQKAAVLRINSNGDLDFCGMANSTNATAKGAAAVSVDSTAMATDTLATVTNTTVVPQDSAVTVTQVCPTP